ncbi:MAG: peptidase T [Duodenibacillus sp.]|nr:peptidase T [Duodenibacillus sp.]
MYTEELVERFLRYVAVASESDAAAKAVPSSPGQRELAELLAGEMRDLGLADVRVDGHAIATGLLPATVEGAPAIGFVCHLDTVPAGLSPEVHPQRLRYEGGDVCLNAARGIWLRLSEHPELARYAGDEIIFTDGTSVLGADNKAAVANVMTMLSIMTREKRPHGDIRVAFVPDEEIGLRGSKLLDLEAFKVDFAYTIDCCAIGEIVYETFNAGTVTVDIEGVTAHPMSSKGVMVNPLLVAADFMALFDRGQTPECTDGKDGYWWIRGCQANAKRCSLLINIRDFDKAGYERRKRFVLEAAGKVRALHPRARIEVAMTDVYGNIADSLGEDRRPIELMYRACAKLGVEPVTIAMRGGTDGSALSARGLVTPNYFTGAHNFHSNAEFLPLPSFAKSLGVTLAILGMAAGEP